MCDMSEGSAHRSGYTYAAELGFRGKFFVITAGGYSCEHHFSNKKDLRAFLNMVAKGKPKEIEYKDGDKAAIHEDGSFCFHSDDNGIKTEIRMVPQNLPSLQGWAETNKVIFGL